jgi:hypothetical protein
MNDFLDELGDALVLAAAAMAIAYAVIILLTEYSI